MEKELAEAIDGEAHPLSWFKRQGRRKKIMMVLGIVEQLFVYVSIVGLVAMIGRAKVELKRCQARPNSVFQP